jgi:hypothetical protein
MNRGRVMGSISHLLFVNVNMKWSDNVLKDRKFLPMRRNAPGAPIDDAPAVSKLL